MVDRLLVMARAPHQKGDLEELEDRRETISKHADAEIVQEFVGSLNPAQRNDYFQKVWRSALLTARSAHERENLSPKEEHEAARETAARLSSDWAKRKGIESEWLTWWRTL